MKNIRIGNDINIIWRIYRNGDPMVLDPTCIFKLQNRFGKNVPCAYTLEGNEVHATFEGRNQQTCGEYTLLLVKNNGLPNMCTVDRTNAFALVPHSYAEGGCCCNPMVEIETICLETDSDVPANGLSAYEIWLKLGNKGTEQDFIDSLRVGAYPEWDK